jgi:hypothetical protein
MYGNSTFQRREINNQSIRRPMSRFDKAKKNVDNQLKIFKEEMIDADCQFDKQFKIDTYHYTHGKIYNFLKRWLRW